MSLHTHTHTAPRDPQHVHYSYLHTFALDLKSTFVALVVAAVFFFFFSSLCAPGFSTPLIFSGAKQQQKKRKARGSLPRSLNLSLFCLIARHSHLRSRVWRFLMPLGARKKVRRGDILRVAAVFIDYFEGSVRVYMVAELSPPRAASFFFLQKFLLYMDKNL